MNLVFFSSVILKGLGAILTVLLQIVITNTAGLSSYGTYTALISAGDMIYWCLFSGLVKCNTFYLSKKNSNLKTVKRKYYIYYVLPITLLVGIVGLITKRTTWLGIAGVALLNVLIFDKSSVLLAEGKYYRSLLGEYVLGKSALLAMILFLWYKKILTVENLILAYLLQYLFVLVFFVAFEKKTKKDDVSASFSVKKWFQFQKSDLLQSIVGEVPVILQYIAVGAFETGVLGIIVLIKKLINFISGPTSKIFLPQFSRLYHANKMEEIRRCFASIMRMQMMFVGPVSVVLIGYPQVILRILAEELLPYQNLFMTCSCVFILAASLGPCGGLMQMTENEKMDNHCRLVSIIMMIISFILLRNNPMFAIYGLCIQTFCESVSKFVFVCIWMKKMPIQLKTFISWWSLPLLMIGLTYFFQWQGFLMMVVTAGIVFVIQIIREIYQADGIFNRKNKI